MRPLNQLMDIFFREIWPPWFFFNKKCHEFDVNPVFLVVAPTCFCRGRWSVVSISMICQSRWNRSRRSRWGENSLPSGMVQVEGTLIRKSWHFFLNSEFKKLRLLSCSVVFMFLFPVIHELMYQIVLISYVYHQFHPRFPVIFFPEKNQSWPLVPWLRCSFRQKAWASDLWGAKGLRSNGFMAWHEIGWFLIT